MKLIEADGKTILRNYGIPVPKGILVDTGDKIPDFRGAAVVKAQLLSGGRGKSGLVRFCEPDQIADGVAAIRKTLAERGLPQVVLIEEKLDIASEYYLGFTIDDVTQSPVMLFSTAGGVEIENAAQPPRRLALPPGKTPLSHEFIPFFREAGVEGAQLGPLARLAASLAKIYVQEDAELIEINPLAVTSKGRLVAADAKVVLDVCAAFRHTGRDFPISRRLGVAAMTPLEKRAEELDFTFVELPGQVALMTYGAGLGMMMVDLLGDAGLGAACFMDGSVATKVLATDERLRVVFKRAEHPDVKAILFYQNLGTRDIKPRVDDVLKVLKETPPSKPFYFGIVASYLAERNMKTQEACQLVIDQGYRASQDPRELVEMIREDLSKAAN